MWSIKEKNVNEIHIYISYSKFSWNKTHSFPHLFIPLYFALLPTNHINLLIVVATYHDTNSDLPPNYPWWSLQPTTLKTTLLTYAISPTWDATSSSFFSNICWVETNNPMSFIHVPNSSFGIKYWNKLLLHNKLE